MPWRPRLWYSHRNFAIGYFAVAIIHLLIGATSFLAKSRYTAPSLDLVFEVAPLVVWGVAHLVVWALMTVGAYHRFDVYGRLGLSIGLSLALLRGMLVEFSSAPPGVGILLWAGFAVWQFTMTAEPQTNPLTARQRGHE